MFKRILGGFLIALGMWVTYATLVNLVRAIKEPMKKTGDSAADAGQVFGIWSFYIIMSALLYFMFKFGFRLVKKKAPNIDSNVKGDQD